MKKIIFKFCFMFILFLPFSSFAKQLVVEVVNGTYASCFFIESYTQNGYVWDLPTRIPRESKGKIYLAHNVFSKKPKAEFIYICAGKTVTFGAEDTTEDNGPLTLKAYLIRADKGITASVVPIEDRTKRNKPILARVTIVNTQ